MPITFEFLKAEALDPIIEDLTQAVATDTATASAAATTATTKASEAAASAGTASTAATTATTQAGIATTKAGEANTSAGSASTSASTATTQAGIATTKAGEAVISADTAATQAGVATTKAGEANTSAGNAATSASTATTQAGIATTQATNAATSASTATTKASEAATSATNAAASAASAQALALSNSTGFPSIRPTVYLDFANSRRTPPAITFARNSVATYMDSRGYLRSARVNQPRINFDPSTGRCLGLLIEEARTNIVTYSQDFSNAAWSKTDTTVTANSILSPDGTVNGGLITEGVAGNAAILSTSAAITATSTVSGSIYVKRGNHDWILIAVSDATRANSFTAYFNTATGAFGTTGTGGTGAFESATVVANRNGWYRIGISGTLGPADTTVVVLTRSASANGSTTRVNNGTRYLFGAQIEVVPTPTATTGRMTSYIPTTTTSVARALETASITLTGFNLIEGTIFAEWAATYLNSNAAARGTIISMDDNTANNRNHLLANGGSGQSVGSSSIGGVVSASIASGTLAANTAYKTAYRYAANDFALVQDGTVIGTDVLGDVPTAITQIRIGHRGGDYLNGHIARLYFYPMVLSNSQMQALTAA